MSETGSGDSASPDWILKRHIRNEMMALEDSAEPGNTGVCLEDLESSVTDGYYGFREFEAAVEDLLNSGTLYQPTDGRVAFTLPQTADEKTVHW